MKSTTQALLSRTQVATIVTHKSCIMRLIFDLFAIYEFICNSFAAHFGGGMSDFQNI